MVASKAERDLVLFLGAGFSRDAGLPIVSEFGARSRKIHARCKAKERDRQLGPVYTRAGAVFKKFQKLCNLAGSIVQLDANNMETLFCMAEARGEAEAGSSNKAPILQCDGDNYTAEEVLEQIQVWLWKVYQGDPLRNSTKKPYPNFFRFLVDNSLGNRITILTTNYDLVFECYAWQTCLLCNYSLPGAVSMTCGIGQTEYLASESDSSVPKVCKLHGSINFVTGKGVPNGASLGIVRNVNEKGEEIARIPRKRVISDAIRPWVLWFDALWKLRAKYNDSLLPAIIAPTYAKLQRHKWLRPIWGNAFEALRSARKMVFIGYSMPESDGHLRAMIQSAMSERALAKPPDVYVFDPSPEALVRYRQFFAPLQLRPAKHLWGMDFRTACETKLPEVLSG